MRDDEMVTVTVTTNDGNRTSVEVTNKEAREYEDMAMKRGGNVVHTNVKSKRG